MLALEGSTLFSTTLLRSFTHDTDPVKANLKGRFYMDVRELKGGGMHHVKICPMHAQPYFECIEIDRRSCQTTMPRSELQPRLVAPEVGHHDVAEFLSGRA